MWNYVGIIRTMKRLERAIADLNYLKHRIDSFYRGRPPCTKMIKSEEWQRTALISCRGSIYQILYQRRPLYQKLTSLKSFALLLTIRITMTKRVKKDLASDEAWSDTA
jgi:hypothetical protein